MKYLTTTLVLAASAYSPCIHALSKSSAEPILASAGLVLPGDLVLADGQRVAGRIEAQRIVVPADATVFADEDLLLSSQTDIVVEGRIVARNRAAGESAADGVRIELFSRTTIDIWGAIVGGSGADHPADPASAGQRGGNGSSIVLSAPVVWVDGRVQAGHGGRGGPGAAGGDGGTLTIVGEFLQRAVDDDYEAIGGNGAMGGTALLPDQASGAAGDGGHVVVLEHPDTAAFLKLLDEAPEELVPKARSPHHFLPQDEDGAAGAACAAGVNGLDGGDAVGGDGAHGANGPDGTPASPNGGHGAPGGRGGDVTGANGANGGMGGNCCHIPAAGGAGGAGGKGGKGTGGKGGNGGNGGKAWAPPATGGDGGAGGNGGNGKGGNGGNGGNGGPGVPPGPGGQGGAGGAGVGGAGGQGGQGGAPGGAAGPTGTAGGAITGNPGNAGNAGAACPDDKDKDGDGKEDDAGGGD